MDVFLKTLKESLVITSFIWGMMLLVEYFVVQTKYKFVEDLSKNSVVQIILAGLLGIIPGCLGTFFAVTLYTHEVFNFSALTTVMIATSGDEAYAMLAMVPDKFIQINVILFVVAIVTGFLLNLIFKNKTFVRLSENHLKYHGVGNQCFCFEKDEFKQHWKNLTFERAILVLAFFLLVIFEAAGELGPKQWYFRYSLLLVFLFGLFVVVTVPEHFLQKHVWEHTVKRHLLRIFLWTFGVLFFFEIVLPYFNITPQQVQRLSEHYYYLLLLIAVLFGIIPESGPNLIFVIMFAKGLLPMSILIGNSVSQDGHGSLPLLAESGKSYLYMKLINIFVGFLVGVIMHYFGF